MIAAIEAETAEVVLRLATKRKKQVAAAEIIAVKCKFLACFQWNTMGLNRNNSISRTMPPNTILNIRTPGRTTDSVVNDLAKSMIIRGSLLGVFIASIEQVIALELLWKQIPSVSSFKTVDNYQRRTFGPQDLCKSGFV